MCQQCQSVFGNECLHCADKHCAHKNLFIKMLNTNLTLLPDPRIFDAFCLVGRKEKRQMYIFLDRKLHLALKLLTCFSTQRETFYKTTRLRLTDPRPFIKIKGTPFRNVTQVLRSLVNIFF